jgi:putative acetyltransferase
MSIEILNYQHRYQPDFKRLNIAWIERYFRVEPHDEEQLDNPEKYILTDGGQVFLARLGDDIVGTVALVKVDEQTYEMAKMAVSEAHQGLGIGKKLCLHLINEARAMGIKRLYLESNRILTPALTLYASVGFVEVPVPESPYQRADIAMELML